MSRRIIRLNMWQRAGVVASVLWAVGAGFYMRAEVVRDAVSVGSLAYESCTQAGRAGCFRETDLATQAAMGGAYGWASIAAVALGPVLLAWLLVYVTIWTARWVWAGRRA